MQALYALRAAKEELKIEALANEEKRAKERHEWDRQRFHWDRQRREDEWDLFKRKMMEDEDLQEEDVPKRRPCDVPPPPHSTPSPLMLRYPPPSPLSQRVPSPTSE